MLEQVLRYLRNWFVVPDGIHTGAITVEGGSITLPFLQNGQYFRICGSVFNDGVYRYPVSSLTDETFNGAVWALAVPKDVLELSEEISAWREKNKDIVSSPYQSESFGGYSYSLKSGTGSDGNALSWQSVFADQLSRWRKI